MTAEPVKEERPKFTPTARGIALNTAAYAVAITTIATVSTALTMALIVATGWAIATFIPAMTIACITWTIKRAVPRPHTTSLHQHVVATPIYPLYALDRAVQRTLGQ